MERSEIEEKILDYCDVQAGDYLSLILDAAAAAGLTITEAGEVGYSRETVQKLINSKVRLKQDYHTERIRAETAEAELEKETDAKMQAITCAANYLEELEKMKGERDAEQARVGKRLHEVCSDNHLLRIRVGELKDVLRKIKAEVPMMNHDHFVFSEDPRRFATQALTPTSEED